MHFQKAKCALTYRVDVSSTLQTSTTKRQQDNIIFFSFSIRNPIQLQLQLLTKPDNIMYYVF